MKELYQLKPYMVRYQMRRAGLKLWWVAEQVGVHKTTLRRWLSGKIVRLHRQNIEQLGAAIGLDWKEIGMDLAQSAETLKS